MRAWKRIGTLILTLVLLSVTLAGCGSGGEDAASDNNAATNPPDKTEGTEQKGDVTGKAEGAKEKYAISVLGNVGVERFPEDELLEKKIEEELNLDITIEMPPGSSYLERLQLMLTSGEYSDLVLFGDDLKDTVFVDAVKNGAFLPLNDYLENAPNLMKYSYETSWEALQVLKDGKIYGIPRTSIARADGYMIRQDWLDKVGLSSDVKEGEPITLAQLEEIAEAFTHDDPDGNGAADTYGLYAFATPDGAMEVLYPWTFGLLGWQEYDGKYMDLKYSLDHDNFERALEFSNKMWKAGLVDPDWPTIQRTAADDRFKKGITGFRTEFAGHMLNNQKGGRELNPDYTLSYVTGITEKEGDPVIGGQYSTGYWGFWGVSSQAEKPERVVELLDYMLSDAIWDEVKYGPKGVTWEEQNGEKVSIWDPEKKTGNVFRNFIRRNDDPEFFLSLTLAPEERTRLGNLIDNCIKNFTFAKDRGYRPPIADDPKFIEYEKNMEVQITKIIVGDLPINDWKEKILPGWYEAGGEEYIKQMQEYIESQEK